MNRPEPPRWSQNEFQRDLDRAVELFRTRRLTEPVEQYREDFDLAVGRIKELMARTGNLAEAPTGESPEALELLADPEMRAALRSASWAKGRPTS